MGSASISNGILYIGDFDGSPLRVWDLSSPTRAEQERQIPPNLSGVAGTQEAQAMIIVCRAPQRGKRVSSRSSVETWLP